MWVAWSSPKPSHCWFSWSWDNNLALSSWCLHELLHDLTSPTIPKLLFPSSGEMPLQEPCPEAKLRLWSSVSVQKWALEKEDCFGPKAAHGERKTPNSGAFLPSEGCAFLGVTRLCVQPCSFPCFSPTAEDPTAPFSTSETTAKPSPSCLQSEFWIHVFVPIPCWFIPGLFQPCRGCCAQPQPAGTQPCPWSTHAFPKIFQSWTCQLCHISLCWVWSQEQGWGDAPLDLGVPIGAGSVLGGGRKGGSIPRVWGFYMGNLGNISCRQHRVGITGSQFLSSCRFFVTLNVLLNCHLGSPAMALLGLLWANTHIYSFCINSFFTYLRN